MKKLSLLCLLLVTSLPGFADDAASDILKAEDIFTLEYASSLEISADGKQVYFVRQYMDIQSDRKLGNIWVVDTQSGDMQPVTSGKQVDYSPKLSPDGKRLAYISTLSGKAQIHMLWLDSGRSAQLTHLTSSPSQLSWSPDGKQLAFQMFVKEAAKTPVSLKGKPEGAEWSKPAIFIDDVYYRFDGAGYGEKGDQEIFVLSADGGTPRRLTDDEFDNSGKMAWSKDSKQLYFSANRHAERDMQPLNSDIYQLTIADGTVTPLTDRNGPDTGLALSPDGKLIAYRGYDDKLDNYENSRLYVMNTDGSNKRLITSGLDRSIDAIAWAKDGKGVYLQYDDQGKSKLAYQSLAKGGKLKVLTDTLGGLSYGRPYTGGSFVVADNDTLAFTYSDPQRPADVAVLDGGKVKVLTSLNEDALGHKTLGKVEEIWYKSSADGRDIQGWVVYPPNFDASKKYPLMLEIHGGPVAAYGPHFSAEVQLFAAAGYVVLYTNPRGSSSYGKDFVHTIHHNYPSQDYDDLMSGVDAVIEKGFIDKDALYVTGGSGGGVLTAWIVGHTDRFAAAVVAKPVINWYSFVLTADYYPFFYRYWFGKKPWEAQEQYMKYSPISYVGNVTTPTMLLTGESDYRTPISETEQYYQALKLQGVETAMVRIPGAPHGIYKRPSNLMSKVEYILWWFSQHKAAEEKP